MPWCSRGLYAARSSRPLFGSDIAKIKGFRGCTVVGCDVRVVPLLRFTTRVAGMGVAASVGAVIHVTVLSYMEGGLLGRSVWLLQVSQWAGLQAPPIGMRGSTVVCFGRIGIPYKYPVFAGRDSLDNKPVTGSLHFAAPGCRLAEFTAEGLVLCVLRGSADQFAVCRALRIVRRHWSDIVMATGGEAPVDDRSGINFGVELEVPWNARRHMCSWIRTESTILRQFRTFWACMPRGRERFCSAEIPAVFTH